jgi:hypothetical protein
VLNAKVNAMPRINIMRRPRKSASTKTVEQYASIKRNNKLQRLRKQEKRIIAVRFSVLASVLS